MLWRTEILQRPQWSPCSRKHMYRPYWSLPMIQRRTGWKCCGQMRPNSSSLASIRRVWRRRNAAYDPRTPSHPSNMEVETLCFWGCFLLRNRTNCNRIKGTMDGAMYRQGQGIEASQGIENGSWMGIQHDNDPKHGQGNKGVAQERSTLKSWRGLASIQTLIP